MKRMTFDKWQATYQPKKYTRRKDASFDGRLFVAGNDDAVQKAFAAYQAKPNTVWTFSEMDGRTYISAGWGLANRLGYFVCAVPFGDEKTAPEIYVGRW